MGTEIFKIEEEMVEKMKPDVSSSRTIMLSERINQCILRAVNSVDFF